MGSSGASQSDMSMPASRLSASNTGGGKEAWAGESSPGKLARGVVRDTSAGLVRGILAAMLCDMRRELV